MGIEVANGNTDLSFLYEAGLEHRAFTRSICDGDRRRAVQGGLIASRYRNGEASCAMRRQYIPSDVTDSSPLVIIEVHGQEQGEGIGLQLQHHLLLALEFDDAVRVSKHVRAEVELKALFRLLEVDQFRGVCDADRFCFGLEGVVHVPP